MNVDSRDRTVLGTEAAVELGEDRNGEVRANQFEVEIRSGRELVVDVVDDELRIRRKDDIEKDSE